MALPSTPGLYAWWHLGPLSPATIELDAGPTCSEATPALRLIYVGKSVDLRGRLFDQHLGSQTGSSTLRRALGGWLGRDTGWERAWRNKRVQHEPRSERDITSWMKSNLWLTWAKYPAPADIEAEVIAILGPPLNHTHNRAHPNWPSLESSRAAWRSWRPPVEDRGQDHGKDA
jgi:hypothetical protein